MSRAMRRQQMVKKPPSQAPSFRPSGPRPQKKVETSAAAVEAKRNRSAYDRYVPGFARDIIAELRKVSWPTREETTRLGFAVIIVSVTIGLALGGVDLGFNWLVDNTLLQD